MTEIEINLEAMEPAFRDAGLGRRYWRMRLGDLKAHGEVLTEWASGDLLVEDLEMGLGFEVGGDEQTETVNLIARALCLRGKTVQVAGLRRLLEYLEYSEGIDNLWNLWELDALCVPVFYDSNYTINPFENRDRMRLEGVFHHYIDNKQSLFLGTEVPLAEIPSSWWSGILIRRLTEVMRTLS